MCRLPGMKPLVPLVELADVDHLHVRAASSASSSVDVDRLDRLGRVRLVEVALELEEPDRAQAAGGELGFAGRGGVQDDRLAATRAGTRPSCRTSPPATGTFSAPGT